MRRHPNATDQGGAVLLEALIAIVIFSLGILALVGLQAAAVNAVSEAKYRSDASFLANQIIGQMWGNRASLSSYGCSSSPYCTTGFTSANAVAQGDVRGWVTEIQTGTMRLPGVTNAANQPRITVNGTQVTVQIFWQAPQATAQRNHMAIAYIN